MAETKWQPIESAPKDTDVLVFADDGYPKIGTARFHTYAYKDGGWWQWDWEYETREIKPTHWMPLPDPPDGVKGERSGTLRRTHNDSFRLRQQVSDV